MKELITNNDMKNNKPVKLYRYRCYGKGWINELYEEKVYMCNPSEFNDPFDSSFCINNDKHINYLLNKVFGEIEIDEVSKARFDNYSLKMYDTVFSAIKETFRVACFSTIYDSILMWSHYAGSHTGYCIEYDFEKINMVTDSIYPAIYSNKRYDDTDYVIGKSQDGINHLLYKASEWSYENEWRIIAHEGIFNKEKGEYIEFSDAITAIYLGVNSDTRSGVKTIKEWAKMCEIPIYKMRPSRKQFKLIKERI